MSDGSFQSLDIGLYFLVQRFPDRVKLGVKVGESTADGRFYLKREEECLAACNGAPMMMVDHVYFENLTPEKVDRILDEHK